MTTIVTGGSGFIGSHLAKALSSQGRDVLVVDKNKPDFPTKYTICDLSRECDFGVADEVFHFAASPDVRQSMSNPMESIENNITATQAVLDECRKKNIPKIIFASTSAVYGNARSPIEEGAELSPISV